MGNKLPLFDLRHKRYKASWYADKANYSKQVITNYRIRKLIMDESRKSRLDISDIVIHGTSSLKIDLHTSKPGLVLGKGGNNISSMRTRIAQAIGFSPDQINLNLVSISKPELNANIIALRVAQDLERRRSYNHSMRSHVEDAMRFGALGVRIQCAGRLNGVEIARDASASRGKVPRQTIRANVFHSSETAFTNCGTCGVKVWINLPLNYTKRRNDSDRPRSPQQQRNPEQAEQPKGDK